MTELIIILKQDYDRKHDRNPNYSLRSYARWLGLSHTSLTLFLNGKRGLSHDARRKIVARLGVPPRDTAVILNGATAKAFSEIDIAKMHVVSDWFYFGVLSLLEIKGFKEEPAWIAKRLNITEQQAALALKTLERLGLATRSKKGRLTSSGTGFKTPDQVVHLATRRTHYQAFDLAKASLDRHPINLRDFSAMTMAIDPDHLPEAKRKIKTFRRRLCKYLEGGKKKEVYRLAIQLFPLSEETDT